jgi:vacuolar-type H+-ATPase subunit I/STV1
MSDKYGDDDVNYEILSNNNRGKKPRSLSQQKQLDTLNQRKKENMLKRLQQEQNEIEEAQEKKRQAKLKDYENVVSKQFEAFFNKLNEPINSFFNSFEEEYEEEEVRKKPSKKEEKTENIIKEPEKKAIPEPVIEPVTKQPPEVNNESIPKTNEKPKQDFSSFLQRRNKK